MTCGPDNPRRSPLVLMGLTMLYAVACLAASELLGSDMFFTGLAFAAFALAAGFARRI